MVMNSGSFLMMGVGFYIKDWIPNFYPRQAIIEEIHVWIRLYNLPHEYWKEEVFKSISDKLGRFIKSDEAIDKLNSCMYARIYVMLKPHPGLPKIVEITSPMVLWRQEIEVEEIMVKCKLCKDWGHEDHDCQAGQKGKGREDHTLEEQLIVGVEVTKKPSGHIEAIQCSSQVISLNGKPHQSSEFLGGLIVSLDSCPTQEALLKVSGPSRGEVDVVANGKLGEISVDHPHLLAGCADWVQVRQANIEECAEACFHIERMTTEVDLVFLNNDFAVGRGIPSQHRFYSTSEIGLENLEKGLSVKPRGNQPTNIIAGSAEDKGTCFKDIHMSLGKVDNGLLAQLESDEEDGLSDDSLGLSAELGETKFRTIK